MLRIATRESPLALWQARHVQALLVDAHPSLEISLLPMTTQGDQMLDRSLSKVGGKGLFVKELEQAMLDGRADIAVHSMKDVPAQLPDGLGLFAFLAADDPRDALVSNRFNGLDALPRGAVVGTASLRRRAQLLLTRPDLQLRELRGNVNTRLRKLDEGLYDAIVLARAGLERLGLAQRIVETLDESRFLPAIAQGVIGIECRDADAATRALLAPIHSAASATRLAAERAFNARLGGACQVPVAGHARVDGDRLRLIGLVAAPDGSAQVRDDIEGAASSAAALGETLAERLLGAGGRRILRDCGIDV